MAAFGAAIVLSCAASQAWGALPSPQEGLPAQEAKPAQETKAEGEPPPIEWLPWSEEVFARARKENRGILLVVGSRSCRPCLVAEREIEADAVMRRLLVPRWLAVKVDRDDRPDLASRYQAAATGFTRGKTGLPVTAFLFATGEVMWADFYVPLDDREGKPGLRNLVFKMDEFWRTRFEEARKNAIYVDRLFEEENRLRREAPPGPDLISAITDVIITRADHENGGFGDPPRIFNPFAAEAVLLASLRRSDPGLRDLALLSLRAAARGGLYDHLGGGFHRGARDGEWIVPYFEKTLAVNAAYLRALIEGIRAGDAADLRSAAQGTVDYILRTLAAPREGFYFSQMASAGLEDESAYYTWRVEDFRAAVGAADLPWAKMLFGFRDEGDLLLGLPPKVTLRLAGDPVSAARASGKRVEEATEARDRILAKLSSIRASRTPPPVIKRCYLDSTALACSALLHAAEVLDRKDAAEAALKVIDSILSAHTAVEKGVPHALSDPAGSGSPVLLDDLVFLGAALVDAHDVTGEERYLEAAKKTGTALVALFLDGENGGFFDIVAQENPAGYLRWRRKIVPDSERPSAQSAAILFLEALADRTRDPSWRLGLEPAIAWSVSRAAAVDERISTLALAIDAHLQPAVTVTVPVDGENAGALTRAAWRIYEPRLVIERKAGSRAATVCVGEACREGITGPEGLEAAIAELRASARRIGGSVAAP